MEIVRQIPHPPDALLPFGNVLRIMDGEFRQPCIKSNQP
jgi:hypothetical protein